MTPAAERLYMLLEFYYPIFDHPSGLDVCGDMAVVDMLKPLAARLRAQGLVSSYEFMRYSVGGYHLRAKFHGERERLAVVESDHVLPAIEAFRHKYRDMLAQPMYLGDFSLRLHQNLDMDPTDLRVAGEHRISLGRIDEELYEDEEMLERYTRFNEAFCDLLADALQDLDDLKARRTFCRVLLMDLLDATGLKSSELHYVLLFIKRQWERYFAIDDDAIVRSRESAAAMAPRFHRFLETRGGVAGSAAALPHAWRENYVESVAALSACVPDLIRYGPEQVINNHTALRLLSMVHLAHNRLGMNIFQEIVFSELAGSYYERRLSPEDLAGTREWVERNLSRYFEKENDVAY